MRDGILRKAGESSRVAAQLFERDAEGVEACVRQMAERFSRGARLFVMGNGGSACDAQPVAVEFQHSIIEKRRALPAIALNTDTATLTAIGNDSDFSTVFAAQLRLPSFSIHRIQEAHTVLLHLLWDQLHVALGEEDVL